MTALPRQGRFLVEFFKMVAISRNTGKCELGGFSPRFSLRQSHIKIIVNERFEMV